MFGGMKEKELILIFSVVGFGSVALVGIGELASVEPGSPLFKFYLNLVFGGLAVFYSVFIHFATIPYTRKVDQRKKSKLLKKLVGEKASFGFIIIICAAVFVFWIYNFAQLMDAYDLKFFEN